MQQDVKTGLSGRLRGHLGRESEMIQLRLMHRLRIRPERAKRYIEMARRNGTTLQAEALADPAFPVAALVQTPEDELILVAAAISSPDMAGLIQRLSALPSYARPDQLVIVDPRAPGLIRPSGTADRRVAAELARSATTGCMTLRYPEQQSQPVEVTS